MSMFKCTVATAVASCIFAANAHAATTPQAEPESASGLHGHTGFGVALAPDYIGGHRLSATPAPDLQVAYETRNFGTFLLNGSGLLWSVAQNERFSAGPMLGFDAGRKEYTNGLRSSRTIPKLRGMGEIRPTATFGGFASLSLAGVVINAQAEAAKSGHGHGGAHGSVSVELPFEFGGAQWTLSSTANIADQHYLQSYFGVTPTQAQRTGLRTFKPGSGIMSYSLALSASLPLTDRWSYSITAGAERLVRDAALSPVVERRTQPIAALLFSYAF